MKLFYTAKDGGPESNVTGYWLIEWKSVFSIVLLKFSKGTREAYHNHAFNAFSWIIKGELQEDKIEPIKQLKSLKASWRPFITSKNNMHRVTGVADTTWALSFRGPWDKSWNEVFDKKKERHTLTNGRVITNIQAL